MTQWADRWFKPQIILLQMTSSSLSLSNTIRSDISNYEHCQQNLYSDFITNTYLFKNLIKNKYYRSNLNLDLILINKCVLLPLFYSTVRGGWLRDSAALRNFMFLLLLCHYHQRTCATLLRIYFSNKYLHRHNYLGKARNSSPYFKTTQSFLVDNVSMKHKHSLVNKVSHRTLPLRVITIILLLIFLCQKLL